LGWPAVTFGQPWALPKPADKAPASRPADPAEAKPMTTAPMAPTPTVETKPADVQPVSAKDLEPVSAKPDAELPPVPPLPPMGNVPSSVSAASAPDLVKTQGAPAVQELPKPTPVPGRPATAPDVSGMPPGAVPTPGHAGAPGYPGMPAYPGHGGPGYGNMLPGTMAPTIPPLCCPPEPPSCGSCNATGPFIFSDVIMIRARQSQPVAVLQRINDTVPQVTTSDLLQYNTDHEWGFRVGGGILCDDGWIFQVTYTQYKDLVSTQTLVVPDLGAGASFNITYTGPGQLTGTQVSEIGATLLAEWNLQLHTVDLVCGTVFSPSECLDLTVSAGARMSWLDQDYRAVFTTSNGLTGQDLRLNLVGAGPIVVTEARVHLKPGCAIYGRGATALLLANREDRGSSVNIDPTGAVLAVRQTNYDREEIVPVIELACGAEFCCCDGKITINTGYEFMYWYELGSSYSELADSQRRDATKGDISLDGWYLRLTLLF
jgi:hypothetical protein